MERFRAKGEYLERNGQTEVSEITLRKTIWAALVDSFRSWELVRSSGKSERIRSSGRWSRNEVFAFAGAGLHIVFCMFITRETFFWPSFVFLCICTQPVRPNTFTVGKNSIRHPPHPGNSQPTRGSRSQRVSCTACSPLPDEGIPHGRRK